MKNHQKSFKTKEIPRDTPLWNELSQSCSAMILGGVSDSGGQFYSRENAPNLLGFDISETEKSSVSKIEGFTWTQKN